MRVVWVHDFNIKTYLGGAELSDQYWIDKGKELGIEVLEMTKDQPLIDGDHYIISNFGRIDPNRLKIIQDTKPYSVVIHGNVLPEPNPRFYAYANTVVFMSPAHLKRCGKVAKNTQQQVSPPFIDDKIFRDKGQEREDAMLYIGAVLGHKGIMETLTYLNKDKRGLHFFGPSDDHNLMEHIRKLPRAFYHGPIKPKEVPSLMNTYTTFAWYLNRKGSYGRTLIEALLCGMELKVNRKNFEIFSYDWDFSSRQSIVDNLNFEYNQFWHKILK